MSEHCRKIYAVNELPPVIPIGVQTENGVCDVAFDVAPWLGRWPDLTIAVIVQRPGETESYPGVSDVEGGVLLWRVSAADTAIPGTGKVEILGVNADGLRKLSAVTATEIKATIADAPGEAPEAIKPWMDDVMQRLDSIPKGGVENAGKLFYVGQDGKTAFLALGEGLEIVDGVLRVTGTGQIIATLTVDDTGAGVLTGTTFAVDADGNATTSATLTVSADGSATI